MELIQDEMSEKIVSATECIAMSEGTSDINVRRILNELKISNRVFYNRFHNVDEVLEKVYEKTVLKIRESLKTAFDSDKDFFSSVIDIVASTLIMSYKSKMNFNQYVFDTDSRSQKNYEWWKGEIEKIIECGKANGYICPELDTSVMSYSIWCFIRGYNADALGRGIPLEDAVRNFRYSFGILIKGMKSNEKTDIA